jgi:hypothetical protein
MLEARCFTGKDIISSPIPHALETRHAFEYADICSRERSLHQAFNLSGIKPSVG